MDFAHNKLEGFSSNDADGLLYVLNRQLTDVRTIADDVANWPNVSGRISSHISTRNETYMKPFQQIKPDTYQDTNSTWLSLIDGSSNKENIPFGPMFVRARGLDFIVGLDASSDETQRWPK